MRFQSVFLRDAMLPVIEGRRTVCSTIGYRPHTHPTLSIGLVDEGQSEVRVGSIHRKVTAGDAVLIPAEMLHSCNPRPDTPWSYRMFYFDCAWVNQFASPENAEAMHAPSIVRDPQATALIDRLEASLIGESPLPRKEAVLREIVLKLLSRFAGDQKQPIESPGRDAFLRAKTVLDDHAMVPLSLAQLSAATGISPFRLIRLFKRFAGLTPHAYQIDQRINHAKTLLRQGRQLADVAYSVGFADQSHFQRAFKPRVATTPAIYQAHRRITSVKKR